MKKWEDSKFFNIAERACKDNQIQFLNLIDKNSNARLLDIGCGDGEFTMRIIEKLKTDEVYGIEIDPNKAKTASEKGIEVKICDVNKPFPFNDCYFDIVTTNQVIEHLHNLDNFFKELYRILKKDGQAIISTPNLCSWHNIFFMIFGMQLPGLHLCPIQVGNFLYGTETHGHIKLFSLRALKDIVRYYGFKIEKILGSGFYPFPRPISDLLSYFDRTHAVYLTIKMRKI